MYQKASFLNKIKFCSCSTAPNVLKFNCVMCVPPPNKDPQPGTVQTVAHQRWWLQGTGWTELSCVCLSTLAVQNILSPVQQAQTGSRMTTQPEGQPPVGNRSDTPEHRHQQLQPRVTLDLRWPVSNQAVYCNPPRVKPTLPIKYNKTHCWNFYCASYSTLFLVVLINSLSFIYTQLCSTIVHFVLPFTSQA